MGQFSKNYRTFYPKKLSKSSQKYGFGIRDQKGTESRIQIRNTALNSNFFLHWDCLGPVMEIRTHRCKVTTCYKIKCSEKCAIGYLYQCARANVRIRVCKGTKSYRGFFSLLHEMHFDALRVVCILVIYIENTVCSAPLALRYCTSVRSEAPRCLDVEVNLFVYEIVSLHTVLPSGVSEAKSCSFFMTSTSSVNSYGLFTLFNRSRQRNATLLSFAVLPYL